MKFCVKTAVAVGRGGGARSATPGRTPQLNMSMVSRIAHHTHTHTLNLDSHGLKLENGALFQAQGRPQFTVQATTTGGLQTEQVSTLSLSEFVSQAFDSRSTKYSERNFQHLQAVIMQGIIAARRIFGVDKGPILEKTKTIRASHAR